MALHGKLNYRLEMVALDQGPNPIGLCTLYITAILTKLFVIYSSNCVNYIIKLDRTGPGLVQKTHSVKIYIIGFSKIKC
jgi:hypothetical protein